MEINKPGKAAASIQEGVWGPLYATLFGAWFAPWAAVAWVAWALSTLAGGPVLLLGIFAGVLTLLLLAGSAALYRAARPVLQTPEYYRRGMFWLAFWLVIAVEFGVLIAARVILAHRHHIEWLMPLVALVVGLHFFPLARLNHNPLWYTTGAALCALVVVTVLTWSASASLRVLGGTPTNTWHVVIATGCAVIFWLTSATSAFLTLLTLRESGGRGARHTPL